MMSHAYTVVVFCVCLFKKIIAKFEPCQRTACERILANPVPKGRIDFNLSITISQTVSDVHVTHWLPSSLCLMFSKVLIALGSFLEPQGVYCTNHGNTFHYEFPCPFIEICILSVLVTLTGFLNKLKNKCRKTKHYPSMT